MVTLDYTHIEFIVEGIVDLVSVIDILKGVEIELSIQIPVIPLFGGFVDTAAIYQKGLIVQATDSFVLSDIVMYFLYTCNNMNLPVMTHGVTAKSSRDGVHPVMYKIEMG